MKIVVTLENDKGLNSELAMHFGQCKYFLIVDVENQEIKNTKVVPNTFQHGGVGCTGVEQILRYNISYVIAGGMGRGAQQKLAQSGVEVFGYSGNVKQAIQELINNNLGELETCLNHGKH